MGNAVNFPRFSRVLFTMTIVLVLAAATATSGATTARADSFAQWLDAFKADARAEGVSDPTLEAAFRDVRPIDRVIELDRNQPEGRMTLEGYLDRVISPERIAQGRSLYQEHWELLTEVGAEFGVPPRYIVALWGLETSYGNYTGGFRVVDALATLAYDGRREAFFRAELIDALRIIDEGHISADAMSGSWAGAMGQNQFMPSSFRRYAVDFDGDGRRDIWNTKADVFASAANYLAEAGWTTGERWGREVQVPSGLNGSELSLDVRRSIADWQAAGVRLLDGGDLPGATIEASVIRPDGPGGRAFMVYDNFRTVMRWNPSTYFATSVGLLADEIIDGWTR